MSQSFLSQSPSGVPKPVPIRDISTFCSRWSVIGKVAKTEAARSFNNKSGGNSKVWNIIIGDDTGEEIQGIFWGTSVDKFQPTIREGKVYSFSRGQIRLSNRKYTTCPHPYQITFDENSHIEEIDVAGLKDMPMVRKFNTDGGLRSLKTTLRERIDCLGIVISSRPEAKITTKAGDEKVKREFMVCDSSGHKINVDVWGNAATELANLTDKALNGYPVCGIRNCKINEYRGKTLSAQPDSIEFFPQDAVSDAMPQLMEQVEWFRDNRDRLGSLVSLTEEYQGASASSGAQRANNFNIEGECVPLRDAHATMTDLYVNKGNESGEIYFRSVVYANKFFWSNRDDPKQVTCFYRACAGCGRKWSTEMGCATCSENAKEEARFILQTGTSDHSATRLTCRFFGKQAEAMIGSAASELDQKHQAGEDLSRYFEWECLNRPMAVRYKAHVNHYQGEARLNLTGISCDMVQGDGFINESITLLKELESSFPQLRSAVANKRARSEMEDVDMEASVKRAMTTPVS